MTTDGWFEVVAPETSVTQGDLILDCPILGWQASSLDSVQAGVSVDLANLAKVSLRDVVVLSQACDLEHRKVKNVVLCPAVRLSEFRTAWESDLRLRSQNPTEKSWRRACEDIAAGIVWSHCFLADSSGTSPETEIRVVFFTELFTLPRDLIERFFQERAQPRLRLLPPYREHLSQSFARFFMRVGLPQAIQLPR